MDYDQLVERLGPQENWTDQQRDAYKLGEIHGVKGVVRSLLDARSEHGLEQLVQELRTKAKTYDV